MRRADRWSAAYPFRPASMAPEPSPWASAHETRRAHAGDAAKPNMAPPPGPCWRPGAGHAQGLGQAAGEEAGREVPEPAGQEDHPRGLLREPEGVADGRPGHAGHGVGQAEADE